MPENPHHASLNAILAEARSRVTALRVSAAELERAAAAGPAVRPFPGDVGDTVGLIAEVKRRSPAQGAIRTGVDPVVHARAAGASAVLLIARAVSAEQLRMLGKAARTWGLATLVEVHAEAELDAALAARPSVLGVNARDLTTFDLDLRGAEQIISRVPAGVTVVAESGVERRADVERLAGAGADLVLVGTSVARHGDPEGAVRQLVGVKRESGVRS